MVNYIEFHPKDVSAPVSGDNTYSVVAWDDEGGYGAGMGLQGSLDLQAKLGLDPAAPAPRFRITPDDPSAELGSANGYRITYSETLDPVVGADVMWLVETTALRPTVLRAQALADQIPDQA